MSVEEQLDELEERLEQVVDALDENDYDAAREAAMGLGDIMDCPLCKNIENGVLGGVMFTAGLTPRGQERRAQQVQREVERFLEHDLPAARERLRALDGEEIAPDV